MADGPASTIVFDGDSTGAVAALHAVDVAAKNTAASVKGTGAALGSIGDGADAGVNKAVAATSRFEAQLKRLNLELESGGRNTAAYIEGRAKLAGADTAALAPLIAQYDQLKAKQTLANSEFTKAGKVMTEYGMTVKGTSAALRQVPAQFTDIIVSLQGGQAPLTVLLQQGGQLKDVFGGVGNAAKALGGYILGLVNPLSLATAATGTLAIAYLQGSKEAEAYNKALITTGNAAGLTSSQLGNMAKSVAQATGGTLGAAAEALAGLAGSTGIASAQFERIATVAAQMEKTTGQAVSETVKQFSELGNDPVKASLKLTETTRFLTAEVYNQIKALVDQGRELEAGVIAQNAWANAIATRTPALLDNLGLVQRAWNSIMGAAKGAWDAMLNVGRPVDPVDKTLAALETARAKLIDLEKLGNGKNTMIERANVERLIQGLEQKQLVMQGELRTKELLAGMEKDGIKRQENSIALAVASDKFAGKQVLMQREIAQARALYAGSDKSETDLKNLDASLAGIAKKYEETTKAAKTVREQVNKAAQEDIAAFKAMAALKTKAEGDEMKRAEDSIAASEKARNAVLLSNAKEMESLTDKAQKLEDEVAMYGMSKESIEALTTARMLDRIEVLKSFDNSDEEIARIKELIAARQRLAAAGTAKDLKDETAKAAKDAAAEWKRTSDQINSTLTDALMRGFESGKGFARTLRDTVVNMFKTMVLRPIISAIMSPISGSIAGGLGLSGAASAAGAASTASTALSGISLAMSSFGTSFMSGLSTTFASGFSTLGLAVEGGLASIATGTSAGISAGIGQALGAVAGPLAIGAGVLAAFGAFRTTKKVGEGITGTLGGDDQSLSSFTQMRKSGYLFGGPKYWDELKALDATMAKAINTDFDAIKTAAKGAASALGLSADSVAGFSKAIRLTFTGDKAKDEALYKEMLGGVSDDLARTIIGSYKETVATVIDEIISGGGGEGGDITYSQVSRQVKTSTYTPSEFARDGETASQTLARLAQGITLVNGTSDLLGYKLTEVGLKGANTASLLIDAFGGAERYAAQMGSYYQNFYTQEEQRAKLIENTSEAFAALGKTMPVLDESARAAYRSMVELAAGQDMSVEANRTAYASLIALQGPMNELAPAFDAVAESSKAAAEALAKTNQGWQDQLDVLTGAQTDRSIALRDAADDSTRALMGQVYAQQDFAESSKLAAAALEQAAESAKAAASAAALSVSEARSSLLGSVTSGAESALGALSASIAAQRASDTATYEADKAIALAAYTSQQEVMQASIDATTNSLTALGESVGKLKSLSSSLRSTLDGMRVAGSDADYRASAQAQISAALATARSGGGLPLDGQLSSALSTVSKPSEQLFGSFEAYARDFYKTANDISALADLTDAQLTDQQVAESLQREQLSALKDNKTLLENGFAEQVSALDGILENARLQLDAANGINTGILSVAAALANFKAAVSGVETVRATQGLATTGTTSGSQARTDTIREYMAGLEANKLLSDTEKAVVLAARAQVVGVSESEIAAAWGASAEDTRAWFGAAGVPKFAQGINRVPYDMQAVIHKDEAIVPAAFNPFNPNAQRSDDTASALLAMADRLDRIEANTRATAGHTAGTDRKLARVIPGNALITEAVV